MTKVLLPAGVLLAASLLILSSISFHFFFFQGLWMFIGTLIIGVFFFIDWQSVFNHGWVVWGLYALAVFLLIVVYLTAPIIRNTKSWIVLGPFNLQPVELAKMALIIVYARYLSRRHLSIGRFTTIFTTFILFIVPAGLTLLQPDMGSASILFGIWAGTLLISGLPRRWVVLALLALILMSGAGWKLFLKDYQRARIKGVIFPQTQSLGVNYSVNQAKIAIGSAGLWGKGYKQGSQTQLGFISVPEADFVFAAFVEEWGIVGGTVVIGAFVALLLGILSVARQADQNFEKYVCIGAAIMFLLQFVVNAGSTVGLFPVVGVTFPFLSYGGSSLLTNMSLLAIITSIARRS